MDDFDSFAPHRAPTPGRPLLGLTVLVVEDSRYACDALRLMGIRSGARIRRADCLASARRHLQIYRPSAVIVDMGLPDGSGADLIAELAAGSPRVPVILATSGDDFAEAVAIAAGADGFLAKPLDNLAAFQQAILAGLPPERQPPAPRVVSTDQVTPDPIAYLDDLTHAADLLENAPQRAVLDYVLQFLAGLSRSADDAELARVVEAVSDARAGDAPTHVAVARLKDMIAARLETEMAI